MASPDEELNHEPHEHAVDETDAEETDTNGAETEPPRAEAAPTEPPPRQSQPSIAVPPPPPTAEKKWYIVHTYSGHENKAKLTLLERVKNNGLSEYFGDVLVPTESVMEVVKG